MESVSINWMAVIVAALSTFVVGGLWFSPLLFVKTWMAESGMTEEKSKQANMVKVFGGSFLLSLFAAINLAMYFGNTVVTAGEGALYGFLTGFGFVSMAIGVIYLFEQRSFKLFLINAGYQIVTFTIMGAIIGVWH